MTLPIIENLERKRGDTKPFRFSVKNEDGSDTALGGFTFIMTVDTLKKPPNASTKVFFMTGTNPSAGKVEFRPTAMQADLIGTYYYDFQMIAPNSDIYTMSEGKLKFTQDISKV